MFKISPLVMLGNKNTLCITFFANIFNFYLNLVHIKDASFFLSVALCVHTTWGKNEGHIGASEQDPVISGKSQLRTCLNQGDITLTTPR